MKICKKTFTIPSHVTQSTGDHARDQSPRKLRCVQWNLYFCEMKKSHKLKEVKMCKNEIIPLTL